MIARDASLRLFGLAAVMLVWEIVGRSLGEGLFAPPTMVLPAVWNLVGDSNALPVLARSLLDMLAGYGLAIVIGIPLGILMGRSRFCDRLFRPWMSIFIVTSIASLVPLMTLLVGTGFWFRAAVVFVACFWFIVLAVYQGARGIERRWLDVGRAFGARRFALLRYCYDSRITTVYHDRHAHWFNARNPRNGVGGDVHTGRVWAVVAQCSICDLYDRRDRAVGYDFVCWPYREYDASSADVVPCSLESEFFC